MVLSNEHHIVRDAAAPLIKPAPIISAVEALPLDGLTARPYKLPEIVLQQSEQWRESLKHFVRAETDAEKHEVRVLHSLHYHSRIMRGECLTGLKFREIDADGLFVYSYKENHSKFRKGDLLVINEGKPQGQAVLDEGALVWLEVLNPYKKQIKLLKALENDPPQSGTCTLDKGFCDFTSGGLMQAIDIASQSEDITAFLTGTGQFAFADNLPPFGEAVAAEALSGLTVKQKEALTSRAKATIIQGPPGSGKTHLLALIIEHSIVKGKSVLLTGPSWHAIDNLLKAVAGALQPETPVYKLKARCKNNSRRGRIEEIQLNDQKLQNLSGPYVLGTTVHQAVKLYTSPLEIHFDLVVIDEAGQMPVAHALPALISAERYVIAGDHKQLTPVFKCPDRKRSEPWASIFGHLNEKYPSHVITLDVSFRMNAQINEFPSQAFYDYELKPAPSAANRKFCPPEIADTRLVQNLPASYESVMDYEKLQTILNHDHSVTFVELRHRQEKRSSSEEAKIIAAMAITLVRDYGLKPLDIAIIAAHRKQNREIRNQIAELADAGLIDKVTANQLESDTVDRLQGQEREVVILSLTSSDPHYAARNQNFLFSANRLNVAITRSRTRLFVVGSKYFFPHNNGIVVDSNSAKLWKDYYTYLLGCGCR